MKETRKISDLRNWDKNPRGILREDFERLKRQIEKFGQYKPLLITPDGEVLGGNMRLRAYQDLGIQDIWVSVVEPENEREKLEYALSDNDRVGYYEDEKLAELVSSFPDLELGDYKVDLGKPIGLDELLQQFGPDPIEDEPPAVEGEAVSKLEEVYQLGKHRLMCGDATKVEDVEKLMDGNKADIVFTDPPYGVKYVGGLNDKKREMIEGDDLELYSRFIPLLGSACKSSAPIYIWFASTFGKPVFDAVEDNEYKVRAMIIWNKQNAHYGNFMAQYMQKHEPCLYVVKESPQWYGATNEVTVWDIEQPKNNELHPTQKPVALPVRAIKNSSKADDIVLDLFGGSGSTLIACEQTNRICYMMELDPRYVDVIRKRYANFIGKGDQWQKLTPAVEVVR